MPRHRTVEPIAPANIPGEPLDPKIPPELEPPTNEEGIDGSDEVKEPDESPLG